MKGIVSSYPLTCLYLITKNVDPFWINRGPNTLFNLFVYIYKMTGHGSSIFKEGYSCRRKCINGCNSRRRFGKLCMRCNTKKERKEGLQIPLPCNRVKNTKYIRKGVEVLWDGQNLREKCKYNGCIDFATPKYQYCLTHADRKRGVYLNIPEERKNDCMLIYGMGYLIDRRSWYKYNNTPKIWIEYETNECEDIEKLLGHAFEENKHFKQFSKKGSCGYPECFTTKLQSNEIVDFFKSVILSKTPCATFVEIYNQN